MNDLYLIPNSTVLKNLLGITNEKELDLAEDELSRANMMLLYENGFSDFSSGGFCFIHKFLFGDVYEWAGQYRKINIQKREELLAGRSVWYSNVTEIGADLDKVFAEIKKIDWASLGEHSEYEHLEKILLDAICTELVDYVNDNIESKDKTDKYEKYRSKNYTPTKHEYME